MAMGQASKLFEQQSSQGNVADGESKESAVQYVLFPFMNCDELHQIENFQSTTIWCYSLHLNSTLFPLNGNFH